MKFLYRSKFLHTIRIIDETIAVFVMITILSGFALPSFSNSKNPEPNQVIIAHPVIVSGDWKNMEYIKHTDLVEHASFADFSDINASHPDMTKTIKEIYIPEEVLPDNSHDDNQTIQEPAQPSPDANPTNIESNDQSPTVDVNPAPLQHDDSAIQIETPNTQSDIVNEPQTLPPADEIPEPEPIIETSEDSTSVSKANSSLQLFHNLINTFLNIFTDVAFATETTSIETTESEQSDTEALPQADNTATQDQPAEEPQHTQEDSQTPEINTDTPKKQVIPEPIAPSDDDNKTTATLPSDTGTSSVIDISTSTTSSTPSSPLNHTTTTSTEGQTEQPNADNVLPALESEQDFKLTEIPLYLRQFQISNASNIDYNAKVSDTKLMLSMGHTIVDGQRAVIYWLDHQTSTWTKLKTYPLKIENSNETNNGYFSIDFPFIDYVRDLQNLEIKVVFEGHTAEPITPIYIDSVWIETTPILPEQEKKPEEIVVISLTDNKSFSTNDEIELAFLVDREKMYTKNNSGMIKKMTKLFKNKDKEIQHIDIMTNAEISIKNAHNETIETLEPKMEFDDQNGILFVTFDQKNRKIKPGMFTFRLDIYQEDYVITHEEQISIGILALNTDKHIYSPGEQVYIQIAALDNLGQTLCDAHLMLEIFDPHQVTSTASITTSPTCGPTTVTDTPDYFSYITPTKLGTYRMSLTNVDTGNKISNSIVVEDITPFDISRTAATRIYPAADYTMAIRITPHKNFYGTMTEIIPKEFDIVHVEARNLPNTNEIPAEHITITKHVTETRIEIVADWYKDNVYEIAYTYNAPNISPYLFLIGPLELEHDTRMMSVTTSTPVSTTTYTNDKEETITTSTIIYVSHIIDIPAPTTTDDFVGSFSEKRTWQIASDAITTLEPNANGTVTCAPTSAETANWDAVTDGVTYPTAGNTTDYVTCDDTESDSYDIQTTTNVNTVTEIEIWSYYKNASSDDIFEIELWNTAETTQYSTTQQLVNSTSETWNKVTFSSLSLTQAQLDDLRIKYTGTKTGGVGLGSTLYSSYASIAYTLANEPPTISSIQLNNDTNMMLSANTTTTISATAQVSDTYGYADMSNVSAKIYRSGVTNAENCTLDDNNCYENTSCALSACAGNTCTATCSVDIQYFADPTDVGTPWATETWKAWLEVTDSLSQSDSDYSTITPEMQSLLAITLENPNLAFGSLDPGGTTDPLTENTRVVSAGNVSLDMILYGTDMVHASNPSSTIPVSNIQYAFATNTSFSSSTALSASPGTEIELDMAKTQSIATQPSSTIWWGLQAPIPTVGGSYSGSITYSVVVNELPWP